MIRAVITDIEGTTSSLSYVKEVMFPYSKKKLRSFLQAHWQEDKVRNIILSLEKRLGISLDLDLAVRTFEEWIDRDLKEPLLKELQGHIWEEGFLSGELRGHLYEDAYKRLKEWKEKGYRLYVYSSGSVKAQKLFFGNTDYGDITSLFDGFFDTSVGNKRERESYLRIANLINLKPQECLFISDMEEELDAARSAGMKTIRVVRDMENISSKHKVVRDFYQVGDLSSL